ncbi:oxygen-dependent protoporphyrinogen oxidase [Xylographa carneopallida]|nr:oxygen-dependent protoporphyrinogen oxidase [Xylographa carneopallida]
MYEQLSTILMVLALATCIVNTAFSIVAAHHGLGEVNADYSDSEQLCAARLLFISQAFGIVGAAFARISVALYEMYLFGSSVSVNKKSRTWLWRQLKNHKIVLWVNVTAQILVNSGALLQVYLQCRPVARQWDSSVQGICVSPEVHVKLGYFQGGGGQYLYRLDAFSIADVEAPSSPDINDSPSWDINPFRDAAACLAKTTLLGMLAAPEDYSYTVTPLVIAWTIEQYLSITLPDQQHSAQKVEEVAILGGGITGLASAFYISEAFKDVHVTLYEASSRLGGWLRSSSVDVGNGKVVFEQGPRTLRPNVPNGLVTLDLLDRLGLQNDILMTSKESVAARNRFIYYPDHLVRMPGPGSSLLGVLSSMLSEPVFQGLLYGAMTEVFRPRPNDIDDESVGAFVSRKFGPAVTDNMVSAVLHGIYAGDVYQLSAKSILGKVYKTEEQYASVVLGNMLEATRNDSLVPLLDLHMMRYLKPFMVASNGQPLPGTEILAKVRASSVYTFKRGLGQLAESLESTLRKLPNVTILMNTPVESLEMVAHGNASKVQLAPKSTTQSAARGLTHRYSHVVSTISGKTLSSITQPWNCLSPLAGTPSVTVMVVNLYYSNPELLSIHGFGYLLPRSLAFDQNPERALGVVFDSDATIGQDEIPGTKLTVMLGGHWWNGWDTYPDEEEGANMAKSILARHLNIIEEPQAVRVALQKECIPQYTVGHASRMRRASSSLLDHFHGRLRVAGNSYSGVGLNDCVRAAKELTMKLEVDSKATGLEDLVAGGETWTRREKGTREWGYS